MMAVEVRQELTNTNEEALPLFSCSRTSVSFLEYAHYREIKSIDDYTEDEMISIWYTEEEYFGIRQSCKNTVKLMMKGATLPDYDENTCYRGLENKTKEGIKTRRRQKEAVRLAVFNEQQRQDSEGYTDEDAIAEASIQASLVSRKAALQTGLDDQLHQTQELNKPSVYRNAYVREALYCINTTSRSPTIRCHKESIQRKRSLRAMVLAFSNM